MNTSKSSQNNLPDSDWQLLGKLELPIAENNSDAIQTRMIKILDPLELSSDFLVRVLKSAQASAARALTSSSAITFGHIHLSIFVPREQISKGKTWGFFNIEKIEKEGEEFGAHGHSMEFYLYME